MNYIHNQSNLNKNSKNTKLLSLFCGSFYLVMLSHILAVQAGKAFIQVEDEETTTAVADHDEHDQLSHFNNGIDVVIEGHTYPPVPDPVEPAGASEHEGTAPSDSELSGTEEPGNSEHSGTEEPGNSEHSGTEEPGSSEHSGTGKSEDSVHSETDEKSEDSEHSGTNEKSEDSLNPGTDEKSDDSEHTGTTEEPDPLNSCPDDNEGLHRLRKTRFYVLHHPARINWMSWHGAKKKCEEYGLKLAKIDNLETDVMVGRELERFFKEKEWIDNWYWINAKFDVQKKVYVWQDEDKQPLNYTNFYYRAPRPKGYGGYFDNEGNYQAEPEVDHCLSISLPLAFPNTVTPPEPVNHGFHTSWCERDCDTQKKGNALCESAEEYCEEQQHVSAYTSLTSNYYTEFWPFSNRKYVVHWEAKSFDEAKAFCEENKMKIFSPGQDDSCLPQVLKNWMRRVTSYSFWTDIKYKVEAKKFWYPNGEEVPESSQNITINPVSGGSEGEKSRSKRQIYNPRIRSKREADMEVCTSLTWNYEQVPINVNFCDCDFNSAVLSPENCNNKIGVICQHPDADTRKCTKEFLGSLATPGKTYSNDAERSAKYNEFLVFGEKQNGQILRSTYKQSGEAGVCPNGRRVTKLENYWGNVTDFENSLYQYDYLAPYWMRPLVRKAPEKSICYLARLVYDPDEETIEKVVTEEPCSNWSGFILCKEVDRDILAIDESDEKTANWRLDGGVKSLANDPKVAQEPL